MGYGAGKDDYMAFLEGFLWIIPAGYLGYLAGQAVAEAKQRARDEWFVRLCALPRDDRGLPIENNQTSCKPNGTK